MQGQTLITELSTVAILGLDHGCKGRARIAVANRRYKSPYVSAVSAGTVTAGCNRVDDGGPRAAIQAESPEDPGDA